MKLNIMTYNIASGRYYHNDEDVSPQGGSKVVDLSKCGDVIKEIAPDFCGLNEINMYEQSFLDKHIPKGTEPDQTAFLAQHTGLVHGYFGKAIHFAKYLLIEPASGRGCVNFFFSATIHRWAGSECLPSYRTKGL